MHKNVFETKIVAGKMWVDTSSFEKWYTNQVKYKKVSGEEPGRELKEWSYSVRDISELLGICEQGAYKLIKSKNIKTVNVDHWIRVQKDSFDRWYFRQEHYRSLEDREKEAVIESETISMPRMAALLGITRKQVYSILDSKQYSHYFEIVKLAGRRRVTTESFERFLREQNNFRLVPVQADKKVPCTTGNAIEAEPSLAVHDNTLDSPIKKASKQKYMSLSDAASMANITRQAVTKHGTQGAFGMKTCGSITRINKEEFEVWLRNRNEN